jgi:hypothetical protein
MAPGGKFLNYLMATNVLSESLVYLQMHIFSMIVFMGITCLPFSLGTPILCSVRWPGNWLETWSEEKQTRY